ncbi:peptidase M24, structural domain-containing protein [Gilbertella persicaria]|uniref:peptidase M24, structural domain-containing protein n=1 Tax=Gilbertella persicaria TaxID=101096 RepID=UPI00221FE143|nr:peptidase M24, structural domain-containing protein [Gilbertella persicaria]KAI8064315.1 peptidase M24, structural domain-containing protein [Gilbertella persicaria]
MAPHPVNITSNRHFYPNKLPAIPTKQHCLRVKKLLNLEKPIQESLELVYLKGKNKATRDSTDVELEFRQESNFFYLTGVDEPGFQVVIDLHCEKIYLVTPNVPEYDAFWKGPSYDPQELLERYDIDEVIDESQLPELLNMLNPAIVHIIQHQSTIAFLNRVLPTCKIDHQLLLPALNEARLIKFPWEINIIRQVMHGSSQAHIALMRQFRQGMTEAHLSALFRWACAQHQIYKQAYLPIVASGPRAAILHYSKNSQPIPNGPHTLVLVDAGGEKHCYGSDITRTFPAHGRFSNEAKTIYNIVLKMQEAVLSILKPGVYWNDLQNLVVKILCNELVKIGIIVHDDQEELIQLGVPNAFYYHSLGHTVGLDVHDVGGREQKRPEDIDVNDPPTTEIEFLPYRPLEKNMVLTVEPGLYFNRTMLNIWTQFPGYQKYFDLNVLAKYENVGGVRIEDTIVITETGYENLTLVPKQVHEIEALMNPFSTQEAIHP